MRLALLVLLAIVVAVWAAWSRGAQGVGPVGALQPGDLVLTGSRVVGVDGAELIAPESLPSPPPRRPSSTRREVAVLPAPLEPAPPEPGAPTQPAIAPRPVDPLSGDVRLEVVVAVSVSNLSPVGNSTPASVSVEFSGLGASATATGGLVPGQRALLTTAAAKGPAGELRLPSSLHLVIDHFEAARFEAEIPISSPSCRTADDGTFVCRWYTSVQLAPIHARLVGRAAASHVALVAHDVLREPGPLAMTDFAEVRGGEYTMRAPTAGDWVVIALEHERHPHFAIVTVRRDVDHVDVGAYLCPFPTELQLIGRMPAGYMPSGESVEVVTPWFVKEEPGHEPAPRRGPLLTWHTGVADAAPVGGYGVDLRRAEPKLIGDGSIVWLRSSATWGPSGEVRVRGVPTGNVLVRIERPFLPGQFELVQAYAAEGVVSVDLAVSRIDVVGQTRRGPLAGGVVKAEALPPRRRGAGHGRGGEGPPNLVQLSATLDTAGVGTLFIPSDLPLIVSLCDPVSGAVVERKAVAYGRCEHTTLVLEVEPR